MKKSIIHQSPAEKLANTSASSVQAIQQNTAVSKDILTAIHELNETTADDKKEQDALHDINESILESSSFLNASINAPAVVVRKLDEVKSALLITNTLLKAIRDRKDPEQKEFPETDLTQTNRLLMELLKEEQKKEMPEADFTETNKLLQKLLDKEMKDPDDISISLKIV